MCRHVRVSPSCHVRRWGVLHLNIAAHVPHVVLCHIVLRELAQLRGHNAFAAPVVHVCVRRLREEPYGAANLVVVLSNDPVPAQRVWVDRAKVFGIRDIRRDGGVVLRSC